MADESLLTRYPELARLNINNVEFPWGFRVESDKERGSVVIPLSKEEYIVLLKENHSIDFVDPSDGTGPYCHKMSGFNCIGICEQFGYHCKGFNSGRNFYCACVRD